MTNNTSPLYEMNLVIDDEVLTDVDLWLEETVRAALHQDGIESARVFVGGAGPEGQSGRTFQFQARDDSSLDELLDGYVSNLDAEAAERFGDRVALDSRILRLDQSYELSPDESPVCLNCHARLRGQYCGHCGQRSRNRLISIWQLLQEAFGDLLELDSRLWRTLVPLLTRPGQLTRDYLEGRRARYMPPFRTYLVLSVIFFVVAFFNPQKDLSLFFEPEPKPTAEEVAQTEADKQVAAKEIEEKRQVAVKKLQELSAEGEISDELDAVIAEIVDDDDEFQVVFGADDGTDSGIFGDCENASISDDGDMPEWLTKRFPDERVKEICERNKARGNENFADAMLDNIPIALIVLLPLMALVLKVLYPLSRRYFVEHLLFFVHFHAFFFLMLIVQILFARITGLLGPEDGAVDSISTLILVIASFYIPVYLYKAMRHVYGQGHLVTLLKYLVLVIAYLLGAMLTMLSALLFAVLSA
jgi:biopolymer transport protein ExbD